MPKPVNPTFRPVPSDTMGQRIYKAQMASGLTNAFVAKQLGLQLNRYKDIRRDRPDITVPRETVQAIARLFKVEFSQLWRPYRDPESAKIVPLSDIVSHPRLIDRFLEADEEPRLDQAAISWARESILAIQAFLRDRRYAISQESSLPLFENPQTETLDG